MTAPFALTPPQLDLLGYLAAGCTTLSFVPQVWQVWRTRSARDISGVMYGFFVIGVALWALYGWVLNAWPIILANVTTLLLAGSVLLMKWCFDRPRR